MKNFIQELFKKGRSREKQIFLFFNVIILVIVMAIVWKSYNADDSTITFTPSVSTESTMDTEYVETTDTTESTTIPVEEETETTVIDETEPTEETTEPSAENIEITKSKDTWPKYHVVNDNDTWYSICISYFGNDKYAYALAYDNNRTLEDYILVGESIRIESEEYLMKVASNISSTNQNNETYTFNKGPFEYKYGERPNPAIDINVSKNSTGKNYTEEVDTSTFEFVGNHVVTGYDPYCGHCCSGTGLMASGNYAINGYSVAASYPIGTTLYIEGYGFYVVEDRGVSGNHIDIAAPSHEACYSLTNNSVAVYIVPNNN